MEYFATLIIQLKNIPKASNTSIMWYVTNKQFMEFKRHFNSRETVQDFFSM